MKKKKNEIVNIKDETPNIKTFTLRPGQPIPFKAGQFMDVSVPGVGEAPFTPSSNHNISDKLDFTIMNVGRVTKLLHEMEKGKAVGLRGPYGTAYPINEWKNKEVFIVGGGKVQRTALFQNEGVTFDEVPSVDDVAAQWSTIDDMSAAKRASFKL